MEKKDKLMYDLLPVESLEDLVNVYAFGANKYARDDWKEYFAKHPDQCVSALFRHIQEYRRGIFLDEESGLPHLAHVAAGALMLSWVAQNESTYLTKEQIEDMQWPKEQLKEVHEQDKPILEFNKINKDGRIPIGTPVRLTEDYTDLDKGTVVVITGHAEAKNLYWCGDYLLGTYEFEVVND